MGYVIQKNKAHVLYSMAFRKIVPFMR